MRNILLLTLVFVARFVFGDKICAVYNEHGIKLGPGLHVMGTFREDIKPGSILPGRLRLENFGNVTVKSGTCKSDYVKPNLSSNWLTFEVTEKYDAGVVGTDGCVFAIQLEKSDGCPDTAPTVFELKYLIEKQTNKPIFNKENYTYQMSFPASKGIVINEEDITVTGVNFSGISLELQDPFDGIEIVSLNSSTDNLYRFKLKTNKLVYLQEDLKSMLVATAEPGEITAKVPLTLRLNEDSLVPKAEFEKSFYDVSVQASEINPNRNIYPDGTIRLKENYTHLSLDIQALNYNGLSFAVVHAEGTRNVDIRLLELPDTNLTSHDIFLQLRARLINVFGYESESFSFLLIRVVGSPECLSDHEVENKEQVAMIVLSIVVVILILVIVYMYFKYVRGGKPPASPPVKKVAGAAPAIKHRRPTPRIISEYTYPLEKLPKPLETLAEVEEEPKEVEPVKHRHFDVRIVKNDETIKPSTVTRKRSVTFVESDEESRQNREAIDVTVEQSKLSQESQRRNSRDSNDSGDARSSGPEERRRRKSSPKMYMCLT